MVLQLDLQTWSLDTQQSLKCSTRYRGGSVMVKKMQEQERLPEAPLALGAHT